MAAPALLADLHHAEIAREVEGLVHIEGCYELPSEKVTAGIAGYDNSEQCFVVEPRGPEQGCQAVDKRRHIRGQGIVVVWTEEQDRVSPLDRRIDIFHHVRRRSIFPAHQSAGTSGMDIPNSPRECRFAG